MKKVLIICIVLIGLISGCEDKAPEPYVNKYEISINDGPVIRNQAFFSINENCGLIFTNIWLNDEYVLEMDLSDAGSIRKVLLTGVWPKIVDASYRSADFIPSSTFLIKNFKFDKANRDIIFEFEGQLTDPRPNKNKSISIKGKIEDKNVIIAKCNGLLQKVTASINGSVYRENMTYSISEADGRTSCYSFSENGYSLSLFTPQEPKDMELKTYSFGKNSTTNLITFEKYIGSVRATQYISPPKIDGEWEKFDYVGGFTLTEKVNSNGRVFTKGIFSLDVFDKNSNALVYSIMNGEFVF
jgi:hypothetical protein